MIFYGYKSKSAKKTLNYIKNKKEAELVTKSTLTETATELEWIQSKNENERLKRPVSHFILSAHPEDKMSKEDWKKACESLLDQLGYDNNQYMAYRHRDTGNDHIHIMVNRVDQSSKKTTASNWDYRKAIEATRTIEQELGLKVTLSPEDIPVENKSKRHKKENATEKKNRKFIRSQIEAIASQSEVNDIKQLQEKLNDKGISMKVSPKGIKYSYNETNINASKLGRNYNRKGLEKEYNIQSKEEESKEEEKTESQSQKDIRETLETLLKESKKESLNLNYTNEQQIIEQKDNKIIYRNYKAIFFESEKQNSGKWQTNIDILNEDDKQAFIKGSNKIKHRLKEQTQLKQRSYQKQQELQL